MPGVCILDLGLPRMDGNELARRLRELPASRKPQAHA
jgi:CheY-like chemotaxis protein